MCLANRLRKRYISVTNKDIDRFQAAKAAIGAGIIVMCRKSGIDIHDLKRVCVGGALQIFFADSEAVQVKKSKTDSMQNYDCEDDITMMVIKRKE
ncbi:MAG: DUF4445 domain-containing protein [Desulfobacterales bacterium]|nr:DUF4445 domain-containing protein [Desulfobacterales bacterium]